MSSLTKNAVASNKSASVQMSASRRNASRTAVVFISMTPHILHTTSSQPRGHPTSPSTRRTTVCRATHMPTHRHPGTSRASQLRPSMGRSIGSEIHTPGCRIQLNTRLATGAWRVAYACSSDTEYRLKR
jgi:hypothetical protein